MAVCRPLGLLVPPPRWLLLLPLAHWGLQAWAQSAPADSATALLRQGLAARQARQLPRTYRIFARAAAYPGETGRAACLAKVRALLDLDAPTTAQACLQAFHPRSPWERAAALLHRLEIARRTIQVVEALSLARQAARVIGPLTPPRHPRRAQALAALASAHLGASSQLGSSHVDSALACMRQMLDAVREGWEPLRTEPLARTAALPRFGPTTCYATAGNVLMMCFQRAPHESPVRVGSRTFASWAEPATLYLDSAIRAAEQAGPIEAGLLPVLWRMQSHNLGRQFDLLADTLAGDRAGQRAEACVQRAIALEQRPNELATARILRSQLLVNVLDEPEQALAELQRALHHIVPATDLRDPTSLPPTFDVVSLNSDVLRYLLEQKASTCHYLFELTGQPAYREAYYQHAVRLASVMADQRRLATLGRGQQAAASQTGSVYDNYSLAVEAATTLYHATGQPHYLAEAFRIAGNAKAWRLLSRIGSDRPENLLRADQRLLRAFHLRTSALRRWRELQAVVRTYPELRAEPDMAGATDSAAAAAQRLDELARLLRKRYPALYDRAFGGSYALPIQQVRAALPTDGTTAAVEFLRRTSREDGMHREELYAFVVLPDTTHLLRLPLPFHFSAIADSLASALTRPGSPDYPRLAARLYQLVLQPVTEKLPARVTRLLLSPDGELWRVPFEALLTRPAPTSDYRRLPYVLRRWQISYAHSLTLYGSNRPPTPPAAGARVLALAPFTDPADPRGLPFTARLLDRLATTIAGSYHTGPAASPTAFRQAAATHQVLHLGTHAEPDLDNPHESHLLLAGGPLRLADLVGMRLPQQLVVLSACQTGIGQLTEASEGLTSLSWGFAYAGAASTLATLWRVDDQATATVLRRFYAHLQARQPKDRALHQAKLTALDSAATAQQADPFYWAGLVFTGDERPLRLQPAPAAYSPGALLLAGAATGALFLGVGFWWWRQQRPA